MILAGTPTKTSPGERPLTAIRSGTARAVEETSPRPATPAKSKQRCGYSDLPVDTCGDVCCRPDLEHALEADDWEPGANGTFVPIRWESTWREASYPGTCKCGCEQRYAEGADIVSADLDGSGCNDGWCLFDPHPAGGDPGRWALTPYGEVDLEVREGQPGGVVTLVADGPCNDDGPITLMMPHALWVSLGNPNTIAASFENRCDGCGCTDSEACVGGCSWTAPSICSSCE